MPRSAMHAAQKQSRAHSTRRSAAVVCMALSVFGGFLAALPGPASAAAASNSTTTAGITTANGALASLVTTPGHSASYLASGTATNSAETATFSLSRLPSSANGIYVALSARVQTDGVTSYQPRLAVRPDGGGRREHRSSDWHHADRDRHQPNSRDREGRPELGVGGTHIRVDGVRACVRRGDVRSGLAGINERLGLGCADSARTDGTTGLPVLG